MKIKRIIISIFCVIFILAFNTCVLAEDFSLGGIVDDAQGYVKPDGDDVISSTDVAKIVKPITSAGMTIGGVIVIGAGLVLGINFITGGPEKMAQSKQQAIGLIVGGSVIFGAAGIWKMVYNILNTNIG